MNAKQYVKLPVLLTVNGRCISCLRVYAVSHFPIRKCELTRISRLVLEWLVGAFTPVVMLM